MSGSEEKDIPPKGKIIEEHLSSVNLDPWYYIYENFINPRQATKKPPNKD